MPDRGTVDWNGWVFGYYIEDTNMEGLTLTDVAYNGHKVLARASLPVVRVKYQGDGSGIGAGCGPFPDKFFSFNLRGLLSPALSTGTIRPYPGKPGLTNVVAFSSRAADGTLTLGLYVYAEIGGYRLWHGWNVTSDGRFEPVLYSSGWSCRDGAGRNDHRHHPYWKLVFRIDDGDNDLWELRTANNQPRPANKIVSETDFARKPTEDLAFVVSSKTSSRHAIVQNASPGNGRADAAGRPWFGFSTKDAAVRRYTADDDRGWPFGAKIELPSPPSPAPSIAQGFMVLWIVSHLGHNYVLGQDDENHVGWHWTGPSIQLVNW
jgi:hypothetical protein